MARVRAAGKTRPLPVPDAPPNEPAARRGGTVAWTASTYFAEGLPWSILHQVAAEFFTAAGLPARQVGFTSALHLTGTLKFLWSPVVDLFGTLRRWIVGTQVGLGVLMGVLATLAHDLFLQTGDRDTTLVWLVLVLIGILSATHDIACDGYYMEALGRDDQARYSGVRVAAYRAAMLVGSSGLVYLGGRVNWLLGFSLGGALMVALAVAHRVWLPHIETAAHRREVAGAPRTWDERVAHMRRSYLSFLIQPHAAAVLLFLVAFKLGDSLMFNMSKVLLRELGVATADRGILNGFGTAAAIAGAVVGGAWIARASLARALVPIALIMAGTEPLYLWLAAPRLGVDASNWTGAPEHLSYVFSPHLWQIGVVLTIEQFCGGMATAAQMVFIMRRCHPEHKAAHFAFATAVYSLAQMATGTYSGVFYEVHGPIAYFGVASAVCIPAALLAARVPTR